MRLISVTCHHVIVDDCTANVAPRQHILTIVLGIQVDPSNLCVCMQLSYVRSISRCNNVRMESA